MDHTFEAIYDGVSFHPTSPVEMEPNTPVVITIEPLKSAAKKKPSKKKKKKKGKSWIEIARSAKLEGPEDFSTNLDEYLYGGKKLP